MANINVYFTDATAALVKAHVKRTRQSMSSFLAQAAVAKMATDQPSLACVGQDGVSWTEVLPYSDAVRAQLEARPMHPGILVYRLPNGIDLSGVKPGARIPEGASV